MNGNIRKARAASASIGPSRVAPTARAIRSALALSATLLALSGSGAAMAGTCAVTSLNEVTCNGVFTDDVTNTVPVINIVEEPDAHRRHRRHHHRGSGRPAATASPRPGMATQSSVSYAEINVEDAVGIYMYPNDGTATVENDGSIYAYSATWMPPASPPAPTATST
jgi:hypothetical protein